MEDHTVKHADWLTIKASVHMIHFFIPIDRNSTLYADDVAIISPLACENICFSLLFAAGDVPRGETSATKRQKFHTDDVKLVRKPVRSTG